MNIKSLTDEELTELMNEVIGEHRSRTEIFRLRDNNPDLTVPLLASFGVEDGGEWKQPLGAFDSYPKDWTVQHGGRTWKSMVANNVWQPGEAGWHEQVGEGETPIWVQPSGAHDSYHQGDEVLFENKTWVSSVDNNTWKPGVYGWEQKDE